MTARAIAAALAIVAIPFALGAQTATPKTIGEVTLFGEEQLKVEAATKTEIPVVTAKQIQESAARTVPDLLRLVAGVNVRWNPMVGAGALRADGDAVLKYPGLLSCKGAMSQLPVSVLQRSDTCVEIVKIKHDQRLRLRDRAVDFLFECEKVGGHVFTDAFDLRSE